MVRSQLIPLSEDALVILLFAAFAFAFVASLGGIFRIRRLAIHPGWLAFAIWAFLAAWRAATGS